MKGMKGKSPFIKFKIHTRNDYFELACSVIKDPFYKNRDNYFPKRNWYSAHLENDFLIEEHNFSILNKIMLLNHEDYFLLTYGELGKYTEFYRFLIHENLENIRNLIDTESERYYNWYFISPKGDWAAISEYDGSSLFIGYDKKFDAEIRPIVLGNKDFVTYLPVSLAGLDL